MSVGDNGRPRGINDVTYNINNAMICLCEGKFSNSYGFMPEMTRLWFKSIICCFKGMNLLYFVLFYCVYEKYI